MEKSPFERKDLKELLKAGAVLRREIVNLFSIHLIHEFPDQSEAIEKFTEKFIEGIKDDGSVPGGLYRAS